MTDDAMSPLQRRMIEDMTIRKLAPKTQQGYIRTIKGFRCVPRPISRHGELRGRPTLSTAFGGERRAYPHSQSHRGCVAVFLQGHAPQALRHHRAHELVHEPRKLPVVLSPEKVARLLDAAPGLKYIAARVRLMARVCAPPR